MLLFNDGTGQYVDELNDQNEVILNVIFNGQHASY